MQENSGNNIISRPKGQTWRMDFKIRIHHGQHVGFSGKNNIYLQLFITVAASVLILHEPFTWMTGLGTVLALAGLLF